ncbi:atrial natriuretic peptide receptor 1-like [Paramacrobiotus metropolitanus]|uniref:atrial natriuretic peptide receptor 1-like n=1 Tax=Paramacrobiotus metropolitanus TaxID=2943436 RepID=UPI002445EF28|nr:atrial natriuretic peptide receptor 1-like [Paramacrobiotus metropolitanus]
MIRINWVLVFVIGATCTGQGAMPGEPNTTTFLNICSILERGNPRLVVDYNRIGAAMDLALKVVNEEILPPEVQLRKLYKDGGKACSPKNLAISHIIEWAHENVYCNIFIGPGCTHAVLDMYQAAESLKIPLIAAPGAFVSGLSGVPRNGFPNMIRTTYTFVDLGKCLLKFMNLFNYTHNSVIVDVADPFFSEMGESFRIQYKAEPLITRKNTTFLDLTVEFRTQAEYRRHLDSLLSQANRVSRVIMIFANSTIIRDLLIIANHKGMTQGQHVYMGVEMYKSRIWGTYTWQFNDFGDMSARTAYQSLIIASMAEVNGPQMDEFARMLRKLALKKYNYTFGAFERVDPVVMAYYDAVTLYGTAINTLINGGATQNITDLNSLIKSMRNITIPSNLQANIDIGANGDRMVLYEIKHFPQDVSTGTAISASPFLRLDFVNNEFTSLGVLSWPQPDGSFGTQLPPNSPPCGFLNSECKEEQMNYSGLVSAAIIIPLLLIISGTVAGFVFYRRLNYVRDPYWWRYFVNDLEFTSTASGPRSHSAKSMQSKVSSIKQSETVYIISTWKTAFLHGSMVSINPVPDRTYHPTAPLLQDLERLRLLRHQNLQRFIGLCIEESTHNGWILYIIGECCTKGCLQDILNKKKMKLDWSFRFSFIKDIVEGIWYLHSTSVQSHGYLTSKTILIDGRFVVKLSEFGLAKLQNPQEREAFLWMDENCDDEVVQSLLWRAPELLKIKMPENGTQKGTQEMCIQLNTFCYTYRC